MKEQITREDHLKGIGLFPADIAPDVVKSIVNKIYNDFESRICENCKHYNKSYLKEDYCNEQIILPYHHDEKFGCNKWEEKDGVNE